MDREKRAVVQLYFSGVIPYICCDKMKVELAGLLPGGRDPLIQTADSTFNGTRFRERVGGIQIHGDVRQGQFAIQLIMNVRLGQGLGTVIG
jgi:hypothetical protein